MSSNCPSEENDVPADDTKSRAVVSIPSPVPIFSNRSPYQPSLSCSVSPFPSLFLGDTFQQVHLCLYWIFTWFSFPLLVFLVPHARLFLFSFSFFLFPWLFFSPCTFLVNLKNLGLATSLSSLDMPFLLFFSFGRWTYVLPDMAITFSEFNTVGYRPYFDLWLYLRPLFWNSIDVNTSQVQGNKLGLRTAKTLQILSTVTW